MKLAKGFSYRNVAVGKTRFGLCRTNIMKASIHWAQDLKRISRIPSLIGISNDAVFRTSGNTEGQDYEARPRGIDQPQQGSRSRKSKTAQGLDHMVQGTQELPFDHSWSVRSSSKLYDQGVCGTRLHHRFTTRF